MSEPTSGTDAVSIPAQNGTDEVNAERRDLARVIDQSIYPHRTARAPRHRAELPADQRPADQRPAAPTALVPRVYETPVWVPKQGFPHQNDQANELLVADAVEHWRELDDADQEVLDPEWTQVARREDLLRQARWRAPRNGRYAIALLLVAALFAAGATGSGLLDRQSTPLLAIALSCLLAASGLYAILVATTPTIVQLDEVTLTVRHRGRTDRFDLTRPYEDVQVSGEPGTSKWRMRLGCPDGHSVIVTGAMVDSRRLAPVVAYAQEYAQRGRDAREERFSR